MVPQLLVDIPRLQELMEDLIHKYPDVKKAREKAEAVRRARKLERKRLEREGF